MSFPISIDITDDYILECAEFFQVHIVGTSDRLRVRIGPQDTVNVIIIDDDSESFTRLRNLLTARFSADVAIHE